MECDHIKRLITLTRDNIKCYHKKTWSIKREHADNSSKEKEIKNEADHELFGKYVIMS